MNLARAGAAITDWGTSLPQPAPLLRKLLPVSPNGVSQALSLVITRSFSD